MLLLALSFDEPADFAVGIFQRERDRKGSDRERERDSEVRNKTQQSKKLALIIPSFRPVQLPKTDLGCDVEFDGFVDLAEQAAAESERRIVSDHQQ